ncbi:MAG: hypothetical protein MRZ79_05400 [Bacteroidia bacterium]|nr:hypothetical protein [Bacteroidia bacterium]
MEELKNLWDEHEAGLLETRELDKKMLKGIIKSRSRSAVARIKRNIWMEIVAVVLPLWIFVAYNLYQEYVGFVFWWPILASALTSLIFYGIKLFAINKSSLEEGNLLQGLRKQVWTMGRYLKIYAIIGSVLVPLLAAVGIVGGYIFAASNDGKALGEIAISSWALLGGSILLYAVFSHLFFRWYISKLYKKHYGELKACLQELEENEAV